MHRVQERRVGPRACLEELPLGKLGDDAKLRFRLESVGHLDDVLVLQPAEDLNLLPEAPDVLWKRRRAQAGVNKTVQTLIASSQASQRCP